MIESNENYSWDSNKRELNINERGLDFVILADFIFSDPNVAIMQDTRHDYNEKRYLAFAMVGNERFCLCFTPRYDKIHLITIFKKHNDEQWRKNYEKY